MIELRSMHIFLTMAQDDGWQKCGSLVGQRSFHDADGNPLIDTSKFPDMSAMTAHGHALGFEVGWYMNNCICAERGFSDPALIAKIMKRSVAAVLDFQFDGIKLDSCSQFNNLTWWSSLLNATGRRILIEVRSTTLAPTIFTHLCACTRTVTREGWTRLGTRSQMRRPRELRAHLTSTETTLGPTTRKATARGLGRTPVRFRTARTIFIGPAVTSTRISRTSSAT